MVLGSALDEPAGRAKRTCNMQAKLDLRHDLSCSRSLATGASRLQGRGGSVSSAHTFADVHNKQSTMYDVLCAMYYTWLRRTVTAPNIP